MRLMTVLILGVSIWAILFVSQGGASEPMGHEENLDEYEVVSVRTASGVRALASWFHQDWKLVYPDVPTAAGAYIEGLSSSEQALLRRELEAFLEANSGKSAKQVREAWLALGAGSWPKDGSSVTTLTAVLETL